MRKPYAQNNLRQTRRRPENGDMRNVNYAKGMSLCRYFRGVLLCVRRSSASIDKLRGEIARCCVTFDLFPRSGVGPLVLNAPRSRSFTAPSRSHRRGSVEYSIPTEERGNEYQDLLC
jgi:hypothetical protein